MKLLLRPTVLTGEKLKDIIASTIKVGDDLTGSSDRSRKMMRFGEP